MDLTCEKYLVNTNHQIKGKSDYKNDDQDNSSETVVKSSAPTDKPGGSAKKVEDVSEAFDQLFNS